VLGNAVESHRADPGGRRRFGNRTGERVGAILGELGRNSEIALRKQGAVG
jgi:hypothetical protein